MCGTIQYMAPEILKGVGYDESVDWWSLGCMVYELTFGHTPWEKKNGQSALETIDAVMKGNGPFVSRCVNKHLKHLLNTLIDVDATNRRKNCSEVNEHPFFNRIFNTFLHWEDISNCTLSNPKFSSIKIDPKYHSLP